MDMSLSKLQEFMKYTGNPGMVQFMGLQSGQNLATEHIYIYIQIDVSRWELCCNVRHVSYYRLG